jgi:hypothetical protein
VSQWLVNRASGWLNSRPSRRSFLVKTAVAGSAVATAPIRFAVRPGTAYELIVSTSPQRDCPPGALCYADGYAEFCCTINDGDNSCPAGTIAGGWWKADGSIYCDGPRYYIDCVGVCSSCTDGCDSGFCPNCDEVPSCDCANGDCGNRRVGCRTFRYGQCNQQIGCVGRLSCRVVSCTPAWQLDPGCGTTSATDNKTANQTGPCLKHEDLPPAKVVGMAATLDGKGYWLAAANGAISARGTAIDRGSVEGAQLNERVVTIAADAKDGAYWLTAGDGGVFAFGAPYEGSSGSIRLNRPIVGMAATKTGQGYWLVASDGGVFAYGDASFHGSTGSVTLNKPVVGMAATPTGLGYWLVASDGGIFAFGDARFLGSTGSIQLQKPVVGMAATPTGLGYWLVASDGGIFAYGDAGFYGSMGGQPLNHPVRGMGASPTGRGYWLVSEDGGIFTFGDATFYGGW